MVSAAVVTTICNIQQCYAQILVMCKIFSDKRWRNGACVRRFPKATDCMPGSICTALLVLHTRSTFNPLSTATTQPHCARCLFLFTQCCPHPSLVASPRINVRAYHHLVSRICCLTAPYIAYLSHRLWIWLNKPPSRSVTVNMSQPTGADALGEDQFRRHGRTYRMGCAR